ISEFDTRRERYTGRTWAYQTDTAANLVADAYLTRKNELLVLERDDFNGPAAFTKRVYRVNLGREDQEGFAPKTLVVDLLKIANPDEIGTEASPGAYGVGTEFSFPFQSVETVVPLRNGNLLIANDNNYPSNDARYPGRPDDTEMIEIDLRKVAVEDPTSTLVAHRGASGYRPEHTLAAYALAIRMCADFIEPDVVSTKDGVLVARHENEIGATTNVSTVASFADRRTTKVIDGRSTTGWFTEDFTLAELKTLRAVERLPSTRPQNTQFNGLYEIPTLDEVADLARHSRTCSGQRVGVFPETKHPTYFQSVGLPLETRLLQVLRSDGYRSGRDPVFIQSFETSNLRALAPRTSIRLIQLVDCQGAPYDLVAAGDPRTYADLVTPAGLRTISTYADGLGACKDVMIPRDSTGRLLQPTTVIADAHDVGLLVIGWTFRRENRYLPVEFRSGEDLDAPGNMAGEIRVFLAAGMDGFFTDNPDIGYQAVQQSSV
ncbi:MAG TPA: glycerophosphodiester phosphodiesterase family protein, partial [Propionibacteriaceae bacterium]